MQKKPAKETKSEHRSSKRSPIRLLLGLAIVAFGVLLFVNGIISVTDNKQNLLTPDGAITVEVVDKAPQRQKGLSRRESLADSEGMLFVFDDEQVENCFWMKDMKLTIDMVWLNAEKEVITVASSVSPDTYPQSFCPEEPAKYGLEVADGQAEVLGIILGAKLKFR